MLRQCVLLCPQIVSPDYIPMRCVPNKVVNGEQVQLCMEDFLSPMPGKALEGFYSLIFSVCRGEHLTLLGCAVDLSGTASDVAAASQPAAAFQGWQRVPLHHPLPQPAEGGAGPEAAFAASSMNFQLPSRLAAA